MIATQPVALLALTRGGNLVASNVRLGIDGVFVNDQKVANLDAHHQYDGPGKSEWR